MKPYKFSSTPPADPEAVVQGPHYRFTILTDGLIRAEYSPDSVFEDRASTFAINRSFPVPDFRVVDEPNNLEIITPRMHVSYDKTRFSPSGLLCDFTAKITLWGSQWRFGEFEESNPPDNPLWRKNLGGTVRTLDGVDGRCHLGSGVLSRRGYAAVDDSRSMLFTDDGWVAGRRPGDRVDVYVFGYGWEYKACMKTFYALSGRQPLLPRWALGNWWSRYHPYSAREYLDLMDEFRRRGVPLSVGVLDMDWHLVKDERVSHAGWGGLTWNERLFPDPTGFGREMHERNLRVTLNDHPHNGIHSFETQYGEMAKMLGRDVGYGHPIAFDAASQEFMKAFLAVHRNVEKEACDFWWIDWQQGEHSKVPGLDPLWILNHFHFLDNAHEGTQRPLIFSRYAGPGSHRYPVGFSGDTATSWASLAFQPEFTATASNIGYGWWSHDVGGHMFGGRDDELVTRWVQLGCFSPILRLHSTNSIWMGKEPWKYRRECEGVMVRYLRYRHRLMPYVYTGNVMASTLDEPLVQPMYWAWPQREEAYLVPNQFFFGNGLVVAPVVRKREGRTGVAGVKVWFGPGGRWVDVFTGTVYDGDRELNVYRSLEDVPVFMHEGSIVTLDAAEEPENGGLNPEAFEVLIAVGRDGQASVLEDPADDSHRTKREAPDSGERGSLVQYKQAEGSLTAHVTGRAWKFRFLALAVAEKDIRVLVDGKENKDVVVESTVYPDVPSVLVKIPAVSDEKYEIVIELGKEPELRVLDHTSRISDILMDYQTPFNVKDMIWGTVEDKKSAITAKMGKLMALGLDDVLIGPIAELLLADSRANR